MLQHAAATNTGAASHCPRFHKTSAVQISAKSIMVENCCAVVEKVSSGRTGGSVTGKNHRNVSHQRRSRAANSPAAEQLICAKTIVNNVARAGWTWAINAHFQWSSKSADTAMEPTPTSGKPAR